MSQRLILLMSSSRLHGFGYLEHARAQLEDVFKKKNVRTILFIPYALKDHDKYTTLVRDSLKPWGYAVEGIHTKSDPVDAICKAEAIFVGGGNTFVLLKTLYEKKLVDVIRAQVLNNGTMYIGSSAGTNVATRSINTTNDMPVVYPPSFNALNLVSFNINPHYIEPDPNTKHKGESRDERLLEFLEYNKLPVLGLREGTSVLIQGTNATLIGDRNARLFMPGKEPTELEPQTDLSFLLDDNIV